MLLIATTKVKSLRLPALAAIPLPSKCYLNKWVVRLNKIFFSAQSLLLAAGFGVLTFACSCCCSSGIALRDFLLVVLVAISASAAKPVCVTEPGSQWAGR